MRMNPVGVRNLIKELKKYLFRSLYTKKTDHLKVVGFLSFGWGIEDSHHSACGFAAKHGVRERAAERPPLASGLQGALRRFRHRRKSETRSPTWATRRTAPRRESAVALGKIPIPCTRSALDFRLFRSFCAACACLGERSEPTCIKTSTRHGATKSNLAFFCL